MAILNGFDEKVWELLRGFEKFTSIPTFDYLVQIFKDKHGTQERQFYADIVEDAKLLCDCIRHNLEAINILQDSELQAQSSDFEAGQSEGLVESDSKEETEHQVEGPSTQSFKTLEKYRTMALCLIQKGYYQGIFEAVENSFHLNSTFIVFDAPSGAGKTLAAVALSLLDDRFESFLGQSLRGELRFTAMRVFHLVWSKAISEQLIYRDIDQELEAAKFNQREFFDSLKTLNFDAVINNPGSASAVDFMWNFLLSKLAKIRSFKRGDRVLVIIDEVPDDKVSVTLLGKLRDVFKKIPNARLLICGTNSTVNMVGVMNATASASIGPSGMNVGVCWSTIITRFPEFVVETSPKLTVIWKALKESKKRAMRPVVEAIESSMKNGGNPLLIELALCSADYVTKTCLVFDDHFVFWQAKFSSQVREFKFSTQNFEKVCKMLISQVNFLLQGSMSASLSDVALTRHFAFRCIPNPEGCLTTGSEVRKEDCSGLLYLAPNCLRALGHGLFFRPISFEDEILADFDSVFWQISRFSSPQEDILVHLACAQAEGYLSVVGNFFKAYEVVPHLWSNNAAGFLNFQNPNAILNSGSLLEVLLAVAIPNAVVQLSDRSIPSFFIMFARELGIAYLDRNVFELEESKCYLPPFVFPGRFSGGEALENLLGCVERQSNIDGFDLLLEFKDGSKGSSKRKQIRFVANDWISNQDIAKVAGKLFIENCELGVLVASHTCDFWGEGAKANLRTLGLLMKNLPSQRVGKVVLLTRRREVKLLEVSKEAAGRLYVFVLPPKDLFRVD